MIDEPIVFDSVLSGMETVDGWPSELVMTVEKSETVLSGGKIVETTSEPVTVVGTANSVLSWWETVDTSSSELVTTVGGIDPVSWLVSSEAVVPPGVFESLSPSDTVDAPAVLEIPSEEPPPETSPVGSPGLSVVEGWFPEEWPEALGAVVRVPDISASVVGYSGVGLTIVMIVGMQLGRREEVRVTRG